MILQISPDAVERMWDAHWPLLQLAMPPGAGRDETAGGELLINLTNNHMQLWLINGEESEPPTGLVLTLIQEDPATRNKNLVIYALVFNGYGVTPKEIWHESLAEIEAFGVAEGCTQLLAYSSVKQVLAMAPELGFDDSYQVLVKELKVEAKNGHRS